MYSQTTNDITISVEPTYLEAQSSPLDHHYVWAYHVRIENKGERTVQLKTRSWRIVDASGHVVVVNGSGVIGEQPVLEPGEFFEYVSGTPLTTPSGIMQGSYGMVAFDDTRSTTDGQVSPQTFDAVIPAFSLDSPHERRQLN